MSALSAFSVAEKSLSSEHLFQLSTLVDGKLAVPLYLFDGFYRHAKTHIVTNPEWTGPALPRAGLSMSEQERMPPP